MPLNVQDNNMQNVEPMINLLSMMCSFLFCLLLIINPTQSSFDHLKHSDMSTNFQTLVIGLSLKK